MTKEDMLMRSLIRAYHGARRIPGAPDRKKRPPKRGYGHILDLLSTEVGICQQQIAQTIKIRQQSVSEAIRIMEQQGYVKKSPSATDRRVTWIYLTPEGARHRQEIRKLRESHAQKVFSVLTEEQKDTLLILLEKLNTTIPKEDSL